MTDLDLELRPADLGAAQVAAIEGTIDRRLGDATAAAAAAAFERVRAAMPRRSGRLAASFRAIREGDVAGFGSALPYAGIIDRGGVVRARSGYLALDLGDAFARVREVRIPASHYLTTGFRDEARIRGAFEAELARALRDAGNNGWAYE